MKLIKLFVIVLFFNSFAQSNLFAIDGISDNCFKQGKDAGMVDDKEGKITKWFLWSQSKLDQLFGKEEISGVSQECRQELVSFAIKDMESYNNHRRELGQDTSQNEGYIERCILKTRLKDFCQIIGQDAAWSTMTQISDAIDITDTGISLPDASAEVSVENDEEPTSREEGVIDEVRGIPNGI